MSGTLSLMRLRRLVMPSRPLRILSMLASPGCGGAEVMVRNLCAEFTARGHSCHISFMSSAGGVGNPVDFEREFLAGLAASGISHDIIGERGFRNPLSSARLLRRTAAQFRPDVLHVHLGRGLTALGLSGLRVPTVYTHHNVANFSPLLFKVYDRFVDRYVAIGDACRRLLEKHVRRPIVDIRNGVPANFAGGEPRRALPQKPLILAVGSLFARKDYPNLVAAAALALPRLRSAGVEARFAIAGEGPERGILEARIDAAGLGDSFQLLGARSGIAELMRSAAIMVNSSVEEGLPIALIEAALSALPAVVTDVAGNSEVVVEGVSGFVVPPGRPDALAGAIVDLLADEDRYVGFSQAALVHSRQFTIDATVDAHLKLYDRLRDGA